MDIPGELCHIRTLDNEDCSSVADEDRDSVLSPAEDLLQSSISSIYNNDSTLEALLFIAVIILGNVLSEELGVVVMEHGTGPVSWLLILSHFI